MDTDTELVHLTDEIEVSEAYRYRDPPAESRATEVVPEVDDQPMDLDEISC